jgi:hypothetical protein
MQLAFCTTKRPIITRIVLPVDGGWHVREGRYPTDRGT